MEEFYIYITIAVLVWRATVPHEYFLKSFVILEIF